MGEGVNLWPNPFDRLIFGNAPETLSGSETTRGIEVLAIPSWSIGYLRGLEAVQKMYCRLIEFSEQKQKTPLIIPFFEPGGRSPVRSIAILHQ